jgi:hypothetical protein
VRDWNLLHWTAASSSGNSAPAPYNTVSMPPSSSAKQVRSTAAVQKNVVTYFRSFLLVVLDPFAAPFDVSETFDVA